jgi:polysaccharide deacetylase 2 family uncharacterized protein YibQ
MIGHVIGDYSNHLSKCDVYRRAKAQVFKQERPIISQVIDDCGTNTLIEQVLVGAQSKISAAIVYFAAAQHGTFTQRRRWHKKQQHDNDGSDPHGDHKQ